MRLRETAPDTPSERLARIDILERAICFIRHDDRIGFKTLNNRPPHREVGVGLSSLNHEHCPTGPEKELPMTQHTTNRRDIPLTFHEVINPRGVIVAVYRNDETYGGRSADICATMQCRYLNGALSPAASKHWIETQS